LQKGFFQRAVEVDYALTPESSEDPAFGATFAQPVSRNPAAGAVRLSLYAPVAIHSLAWANNGWLQELPDPVTKIAWGNFAALSIDLASELGLADGDRVTLTTATAECALPVVVQPGLPKRSVSVAGGYGRRRAGRIANGVGENAFTLFATSTEYGGVDVSVKKAGAAPPLAYAQIHASQEGRHLVRTMTLEAALGHPERGTSEAQHVSHHGPAHDLSLWPGHDYKGHRWGMAVNLDACTGCGACVVSCGAENNIPVVGQDEVRRRREMHWLRIDRYYDGSKESPQMVQQPMMCLHCENAPCETVCPVLATVHSEEGLNQQVYNRCVGTRYCANNCPPKVRRFNWFQYRHDDPLERMVLNPDVVVRSRGVMEKCSMCSHRIEAARAAARRAGRRLQDGDIQTACQQSCPTKAIVFGDSNDPKSELSKLARQGRAYTILEELHINPAVRYLARVRESESNEGSTANAHGHDHHKGSVQ
jgi:molybdopterin-containing oxidoreductase family iron-sulfur binding subunit